MNAGFGIFNLREQTTHGGLHNKEPYPQYPPNAISVRQAKGLLTASFRFPVTGDTLAVRLCASHHRARSGLSPVRFRPCRAHLAKAPAPPNQAEPGLFLESKPCFRDSSLNRNDCQETLSNSGNLPCTTPTSSDGGEIYEQDK